MSKIILTEQNKDTNSLAIQNIKVTTPPTRITYASGDKFNSSGMIIKATYAIKNEPIAEVEITGYTVSPQELTDGISEVTITYSENGTVYTTTQPITVKPHIKYATVISQPLKTTYEYGETFSKEGLKIRVVYTDNYTIETTDFDVLTSAPLTKLGTKEIMIAYRSLYGTANEYYKIYFNVTVERKSVPVPTWKSNLNYNTNNQTVTDPSYWNNYNTSYMTINGTTTATNAGTYTATFTPNSNYRWSDKTTTSKSVNWTINKINNTVTLDPTSITLDGNNLTKTVTVNRLGNGAISFTPSSINGLTLSLSNNIITIKGDGTTPINSTITVNVASSTNYYAAPSKTFTVSTAYWEWGEENAIGDDTWWNGLRNWVLTSTPEEREACISKTKVISLSEPILGTQYLTMQCIGADQDGDKTLAFQSKDLTPEEIMTDSKFWLDSPVREECIKFYNVCSAKNAIKTVKKGTCLTSNNSTVTYTDETVWLPSIMEMGITNESNISLNIADATATNAECTYGFKEAYSYYTTKDSLKKTTFISTQVVGDGPQYIYWTRSSSNYSSSYCPKTMMTIRGVQSQSCQYQTKGALAPAFVIG